jgi:hypothetical protein
MLGLCSFVRFFFSNARITPFQILAESLLEMSLLRPFKKKGMSLFWQSKLKAFLRPSERKYLIVS